MPKKRTGDCAGHDPDVREALVDVCYEAYENGGHWAHPADNIAEAILARFTLVPRPQVKPDGE